MNIRKWALQLLENENTVLVDTETTGFRSLDEVVQVGGGEG